MMQPLLRKDFRLNQTVILIMAAITAVPYAIAIAFAVNESYASSMPIHRSWPNLLMAANHFCLMHWPVAAALLGGNAFACERTDRSAEFLAYLPPSRQQIAVSKLFVAATIGASFWLVNLILFWLGSSHLGDDTFQYLDLSEAMPKSSFVAIGVLTFGVSWLASTVLRNTGPAVVLGLAAPVMLFAAFQFLKWCVDWPSGGEFARWYTSMATSVGLLAFLYGWQLYLSRYES